jgi:pimeloyl-ACP methyl ester carboxylesterase
MCRLSLVVSGLGLSMALLLGSGGSQAFAQSGQPAPLKWAPCADLPDTECASLPVPIDYAKPDGAKITLALARVPVRDPAKRKGVLMFLPGGPGGGILDTIGGPSREDQHIADFREYFDVVTFDVRGVGRSNPIRCDPAAVPKAQAPLDHKPSQAEWEAVVRDVGAFLKTCADATGELFWQLNAKNTAQDIERIRQALSPNDGLVAYGPSYGSNFGATYLEAFPKNVKALNLDGVVDHTVDYPTFISRNVLSVQDAFERFQAWCARETKCALHGKDLGAAYDASIAREPSTRMLASQFLAAGDNPEFGWPVVARMMAEVANGETKTLKQVTEVGTLSKSEDPWLRVGKDGLFRATMCSDFGPQGASDYPKLAAMSDELAKVAPRFLWKFWNSMPIAYASAGVGVCAGWPREAANPPHTLKVAGFHRDVMVSNPTHDPATPLSNATSVWLQIPLARLMIADVDGHQTLPNSKCAYEADLRFFTNPEAMPLVTLCGK